MARKKSDKQDQDHAKVQVSPTGARRQEAEAGPLPKMKRKEYEREMRVLHGELVAMQEWVKSSGAKVCIVFEGRDTAGKGGTIKLSDLDLKSYRRWYDYSRARDAMFAATDTGWAPWYIAHTDDKKRGRLNIISHLHSQVPYQPLAPPDVTLPRRQRPGGYVEPGVPPRHIPAPF